MSAPTPKMSERTVGSSPLACSGGMKLGEPVPRGSGVRTQLCTGATLFSIAPAASGAGSGSPLSSSGGGAMRAMPQSIR